MENTNNQNLQNNPSQKIPLIRTLKDDIEKAKQIKNSGQEIKEPPIISAAPTPPPAPEPPKKSPEITRENPFRRSEILNLEDRENPPIPKKTQFEVSPIHTYTSDVAEVVKKGNTSIIEIAVAEQKNREIKLQIEQAEKAQVKKNVIMIIGSIAFISLGLGVFYYFIFFAPPQKNEPQTTETPQIIKTERQKEVIADLDRRETLKKIREAIDISMPSSSLISIIIKDSSSRNISESQEFLSIIAPEAPSSLTRSLSSKYVLGAYFDPEPKPFLLLSVDSYENTFAGMLKWEDTMRDDLKEIFLKEKDKAGSYQKISTSTPFSGQFEDKVIKNRDVRLLKNIENNNIILSYAFINKDILIISSDPETIDDIAEKLRADQIIR